MFTQFKTAASRIRTTARHFTMATEPVADIGLIGLAVMVLLIFLH